MSIIDFSNSPPQVVTFNSKDRISGTNSSFQSKVIDLGSNTFDTVCLVQSSIPKSNYNMPSGYNTFGLTELGTTVTVSLSPGSYNKNNLLTALTLALNSASPNGWAYVTSYPAATSQDTFKYTFTVTGNGGNQPEFVFRDGCFRQLGFEQNTTYPFTGGSLTAVNAINLQYVLRMFIKSNIVTEATDGILEEILSVGSFPPLSVIYYQQYNFDINSKMYNMNNSNSWQFTLVDGYDQLVDLNGIPWAFTIVFFERNKTAEIHKNELLINNEQRLFDISRAQEKIQQDLQGSDITEPVFPVKANYVLPELLEPEIHNPRKIDLKNTFINL